MKCLTEPRFWFPLGLAFYPLICIAAEIVWLITMAIAYAWLEWRWLGQMAYLITPDELGWRMWANLLLGIPLGTVSGYCAKAWQNQLARHDRPRRGFPAATICGFLVFAFMLYLLHSLKLGECIFLAGFLALPLVWSAGLMVFGFFVRPPKPEASTIR